jgi:hypothetical protein
MQTKTLPDMDSSWPPWVDSLRRIGLGNLAAWVLEAAGPLTALGAQIVYLGSPLLRPGLTNQKLDSLAELLEDSDKMKAFTAYLREEGPL